MPRAAPRTALDFSKTGYKLVVGCGSCGNTNMLDPESIMLTFGEGFDIPAGLAEVKAQLYCAVCGEPRPSIYIWQPMGEREPAITPEAELVRIASGGRASR